MTGFYRGPRRRGPASRGNRRTAAGVVQELNTQVHGIATSVRRALGDAMLPEEHRHRLREINGACRELVRLALRLQDLAILGADSDIYAVVCIHCGETILSVRDVGTAEVNMMLDHLRRAHPERS